MTLKDNGPARGLAKINDGVRVQVDGERRPKHKLIMCTPTCCIAGHTPSILPFACALAAGAFPAEAYASHMACSRC